MTRWIARKPVKLNGQIIPAGAEVVGTSRELGMLPKAALEPMPEHVRVTVLRAFRIRQRRVAPGDELILTAQLARQLASNRMVRVDADASGVGVKGDDER